MLLRTITVHTIIQIMRNWIFLGYDFEAATYSNQCKWSSTQYFYNNYNSANIVLLSDLKFDLSNTESFNLAKHNGLKDSNFLTWTGARCAVPSHLRIRSREVNRDHVRSLQFKIGDKIFDPALSKSRDFYSLLVSSKATESRGFTKLKSKFSIDDVETKKAFSLIRSCICDAFSLKYWMTFYSQIPA